MKKQLTVAMGLAVLATPAFATKARLEALGEDNYGSYYIQDNRNQFLNPAKINDNKDLVTYEFGASTTTGAATLDTPQTPKAEAGFNKAWNNMVYGLHFGNTTPTVGLVRSLGGTTLQERNPWDLFIGGDAGVKWGANLTYENSNVGRSDTATGANRLSSEGLRARVGVVAGDLEVFGHVSLKGDAKNYNGSAVDGKTGYLIGAGYLMNNYKFFGDFRQAGAKYMNPATTGTAMDTFRYNELRLGVGRQERLNDKATLFAKLSVERRATDDKGASSLAGLYGVNSSGKSTRWIAPINVGLEYDATSWLTLRTSVTQALWSSQEIKADTGGKSQRTIANTVVRAGASVKFGEFSIDGLISTFDSTNTLGTASTQAYNSNASTGNGNGTLRLDSLMSRVSMTYRF